MVQSSFTTTHRSGSAFYLYGVISEFNDTISSIANYSYFIDGDLVGTFTRSPSGQPAFHYNFLLYANSSIPNGTHQFSMQNGQDGDTQPSLVLLDYAIYSTSVLLISSHGQHPYRIFSTSDADRAASSSSTSPSTSSAASSSGPFASQYFRTHVQNIVIAGVISFAIFMMALVAIAYYRHRRHRFNSRGQYDPIDATAHPMMAHWEDLPQTPTSVGGFHSRPNKHISTPYRSARISDSEAVESLLRPTTSLSSGSSRSTRLDSSTSGTFGDHIRWPVRATAQGAAA